VVPDIVHLHLVPGEAGVVLLDQYFAQVERAPAHGHAGPRGHRLDPHDRQIAVNAAVEEKELERRGHGHPLRVDGLGTYRHVMRALSIGTRQAAMNDLDVTASCSALEPRHRSPPSGRRMPRQSQSACRGDCSIRVMMTEELAKKVVVWATEIAGYAA